MLTHADWEFMAKQNQDLSVLAEAGKLTELADAVKACDWQLPPLCDYDYQTEHCRTIWGPTAVHSQNDLDVISLWVLPNRPLLDVGFGYGHILKMLDDQEPHATLYGVDSSKVACEFLRRELPGVSLEREDVTVGLPYDDNMFGIVLFTEVLEHLSPAQGQKALAEVRRVLADDGRMIFSTRINENLGRSLVRCPNCQTVQHPAGHVRSFSETLLRAELKIAGWWPSEIIRSPGGILTRCAKLC